ncbi:hypothetical protein ACROYT_G040494 [Oculina patagonica]
MFLEGIQSDDLCKIRSNAGDKKTSGVDAEKKLAEVYRSKYRISLDHEILRDHGVFNARALADELVFEIKLNSPNVVVRGTDPSKLGYELTDIQLEYEAIYHKELAREVESTYINGKTELEQRESQTPIAQEEQNSQNGLSPSGSQVTSTTPATKPAKNPKRVAAGSLTAEKTKQAREEQKKAAVKAAAIIAKEKEKKSVSAKRSVTPSPKGSPVPESSGPAPPESSGFTTNQWISLLSVGVAIITTYVKREDIKSFFKKSREVQKNSESNFVQESETPGALSALPLADPSSAPKLQAAELSSRIPRPKRDIRPMD